MNQGGRLKNIRNKNKTSWNNLCVCQINTYTISGIQLFEKQRKPKNTITRSANTIKKKKQLNKKGVLESISLYVVMLPKGIKIPLWKVN
ncbi:hypothetical protein H8356DRAFT_1437009 [Neocallimastix lanati (nom. inval.)]|nr:hypothetical protein H8356DRAFT_1437009 [Neocallimastix sp. JGI-2020a]